MAGWILRIILFLVIIRLAWRFIRGVLEGAGRVSVAIASERWPGARPGLRRVRRAIQGADRRQRVADAVLLLGEMQD